MTFTFTVRPATIDDAAAVADVHVRSWQAAYRGLLPDAVLDGLSVERRTAAWRQGLAEARAEVWAAVDGGRRIGGWIAFGASRDEDAPASAGEVEALYLLPAHWSTGMGRALWLKARERLAARGFATATLWVLEGNARAIRFYEAAGFAPDGGPRGRRSSERGGAVQTELRYTAALS